MPDISIIVPVYNIENYLAECVESIVNQTYGSIEIILVDDGSTDTSGKMCDDFAKEDARIKVYHLENSGPSTARNYGLEKCSGDYIMFVDSDDRLEKNTLEVCSREINKNNCDMVIFDFCDFSVDSEYKHYLCEKEFQMFEGKDIEKIENMILETDDKNEEGKMAITGPWCKLMSRDIVNGCVFPENIKSGEDACFVAQVLNKTQKVVYMHQVLYNRRLLKESLSHTCTPQYGQERQKYVNWILDFYSGKKSEKMLDDFCFKNYFLVVQKVMTAENIKFGAKCKVINNYIKAVNRNVNYKNIKTKSCYKGLAIIQYFAKRKNFVIIWLIYNCINFKRQIPIHRRQEGI